VSVFSDEERTPMKQTGDVVFAPLRRA
jgi:hypothetical protein